MVTVFSVSGFRPESFARRGGLISPPSIRFARTGTDFATSMGPAFDPLAGAAAAAALVTGQLFEPARLNRVMMQHVNDSELPGPGDYVRSALERTSGAEQAPVAALVAEVARSVIVRAVITALRSGALHALCEIIVRAALVAAAGVPPLSERETILSLFGDGSMAFPWPAPVIPDGVPI